MVSETLGRPVGFMPIVRCDVPELLHNVKASVSAAITVFKLLGKKVMASLKAVVAPTLSV